MPKIAYLPQSMGLKSLQMVEQANSIIAEYQRQGYTLTLRQLYYQFVSKGWLPNTVQNYKRLGNIINDGRLQGLIDWNAIEDRTRGLASLSTWETPSDIIDSAVSSYRNDLWARQNTRIEVWVEKEALAGVIEQVANRLRVPFLSCRGYTSQSEMWLAGKRLRQWVVNKGQNVVILHLGDHDPSGIDMSRDIQDRLAMFMGPAYDSLTFKRIALNLDQIEQYNPPPNPAKTTDSRYNAYRDQFGDESWELDALNPAILDRLITEAVNAHRDMDAWDTAKAEEDASKHDLEQASERWADVVSYLNQEKED